jgi:hypothetical protein
VGVLEELLRNALIRRRHDLREHGRRVVESLAGSLSAASSGVSARVIAIVVATINFTLHLLSAMPVTSLSRRAD